MSNVSLINGHIDGAETCVICGRDIPEGSQVCVICGKVGKGKQTNYDRIRNMSVDEMSDFLRDWALRFMQGKSPLYVEKWLESEVDTE